MDEVEELKKEITELKKENDELKEDYKKFIQQFSLQYLESSDFYVGPELPREHYLQSKKDVIELYIMFVFYAFAEPYINAYHNKFLK